MAPRGNAWWPWVAGGIALFTFAHSPTKKVPPRPAPSGPPPTLGPLYTVQNASNGAVLRATAPEAPFTEPRLSAADSVKFWRMVDTFREVTEDVASTSRIPLPWLFGIMWAESKGDPHAQSPAGALGLMQVMPFHFRDAELPLAFEPKTNLQVAARYLQVVRGKVSDLPATASMYNAGGPFTNASWLASGRKPALLTRWGVPAEPGYIDSVVAANNTFLAGPPAGDA